MGISLKDLIYVKPVELADLSGTKIAIDAFNWMYAFLSIIRDRFTGEPLRDSKGRVTSHLSGLFYRTTNLLENGIDPVFVFDGEPPAFKRATSAIRGAIKKEAEEKLEEARVKGDEEAIRRYAQATSRLTEEMVSDAKSLLGYMGIPVVQAPSEGEAMCAYLCKTGEVVYTASQDYDSLAFGSPKLVRNLAISGKRKLPGKEAYTEVKPEVIDLVENLNRLGITKEQLVIIGILIGTDYNPGGVRKIGPKTALKMVKGKNFDEVFNAVKWDFETSAKEIFEFFRNPPVGETEIKRIKPDLEKLKGFMLDFDFSEERVDKTIERLGKSKRDEGLQKWFKS